jgi:hypothetical protein
VERRIEGGREGKKGRDGGNGCIKEGTSSSFTCILTAARLEAVKCSMPLFLFHFSNPLFSLLITMDLIALENRMVPVRREKFSEKIGKKKTKEFDKIRTGIN